MMNVTTVSLFAPAWRRSTLAVTATLAALLLAACGGDRKPEAPKTEPPRPVRYQVVGASDLNAQAALPGSVQPRHEQRYGFRVGGKLARREVEVGQTVRAGQVLAVLDAQDVLPAIAAQRAQVTAAQTQQRLQHSELQRQRSLHAQGFISAAALERQAAATEAAQAQLQAAQAQLNQVQNGLSFQTLRADRPGVVTAIEVEAGSVVAAGQTVLRVAQLGEKEVVINVPERRVAALRQAQGFTVRFEALPGVEYSAQLRELSPAADAASRTYSARLALDAQANVDAALNLGMSATVQIALAQAEAIVVPTSALQTRNETVQVWRIDPQQHTVQPVAVTLGETTPEGVVVTTGLNAGDWVVTAGANLLLAGQAVRVLDAPTTPATSAGAQ